MDNSLGFIYFDTNALIKYLLGSEKGSKLVTYVVENAFDFSYLLYTSQIGIKEAKDIIKRKKNQSSGHKDYICKEKYDRYLCELRNIGNNHSINILDYSSSSNIKRYDYVKILNEISYLINQGVNIKKIDKNDARHWAVALNHLGYFEKVKIMNSDKNFNIFIKYKKYEVINPEKITLENLKSILNSE